MAANIKNIFTALILSAFITSCTTAGKNNEKRRPQIKAQKISWPQAVKMIKSGKVVSVSQTHSLTVYLYTHDNKFYQTKESQMDEIIKVLYNNGIDNRNIKFITE